MDLPSPRAKEVITPESGEKIHILGLRWNSKNFWRRSGTEKIHLDTGSPKFEENVIKISLENQKGLHHHYICKTHFGMPVKKEMISGPFRETSYAAITLIQESNSARREKNHFLFH